MSIDKKNANQTIILNIFQNGNRYQLGVTVMPANIGWHVCSLEITREMLSARLTTVRRAVNRITRKFGHQIHLTDSNKEEILHLFGREGYDAFADWVGPRESRANQLITSIMREYSVKTLCIQSEQFSLPWELITTDFENISLWGLSYQIQRQLPQNRGCIIPEKSLRLELGAPPEIGLLILQDPDHLPSIVGDEIPFFLDLESKNLITCTIMKPLNKNGDLDVEFGKLKMFGQRDRNIYHFSCHAIPDPYNSARSCIVIDDGFPISSDDLRRYGIEFRGFPLIVLNACDTGKNDPYHTADLVSNLLNSDALGVVATEAQIPDMFAAAFTKEFYKRLLAGERIGLALANTRKFFMSEYNNPLGLLYSLYKIDPNWQIVIRKIPPPQ